MTTTTAEQARQGRTRWHLGLRHKDQDGRPCPVQNVTLGGVTFSQFTERVTGYHPDTRRDRYPGSYRLLSAADLERIRKAFERTVIRWRGHDETGKVRLGRCYSKDSPDYFPVEGDEDLSAWLVLRRHDGATPFEGLEEDPVGATGLPWSPPATEPDKPATEAKRRRK